MEKYVTVPGIILISGPKGSGKTYFIKYLLYCLAKTKKVDYIKVICPTAYSNTYDYLESSHVSEEYNEIDIYELIDTQIDFRRHNLTRSAVLVLDDCIGTANFRAHIWEKLATTCRHYNLTVIIVTQHIFRLAPTLRDNSDTVVILRTVDIDNLRGLYNTCGRWKWREFSEFETYVMENTKDFKCIIINKGNAIQIVRAPERINKFLIKC